MNAPGAAKPHARPWRRLAAVTLIFLVIGPPVGAALLVGGTELVRVRTFGDLPRVTRWFVNDPMLVFGMGYVIGGLPAIFSGLIVGLGEAFRAGATWLWALAAGLLSGSGLIAFLFLTAGRRADDMRLVSPQTLAIMLVCIVPTFVCWAVVRTLYRRISPPAVTP